jgi:hypothetical protein
MWLIDRMLAEKARQWEEEDYLVHEEEHRKMGRRWVDLDGDQLMDVKDEVADTLSDHVSWLSQDSSTLCPCLCQWLPEPLEFPSRFPLFLL